MAEQIVSQRVRDFRRRKTAILTVYKKAIIRKLGAKADKLDASNASDEYALCHLEGYALCLKDIINLINET